MRTSPLSLVHIAFLGLMLVGLLASAFHASGGRWGNALIAGTASLLGIVLTLSGVLRPAAVAASAATAVGDAPATRRTLSAPRQLIPDDITPRQRWLSASVIAGFAATIVMSVSLVIAYIAAGSLAVQNGGQMTHWFWNLTHNDVTSGIFDVPIAAGSINVLAGLAWALLYGGAAESRLRGPGWLRGMTFSLAPWLLSLLVFFPIIGAGFLGTGLDAGPLPIVGNLVLHLVFGFALGAVYGLPELSNATSAADARVARAENDGVAVGLVLGLTAGLVCGAVVGLGFADTSTQALNVTLAGGAIGVAIGGLLGSFAGLEIGTRRESLL